MKTFEKNEQRDTLKSNRYEAGGKRERKLQNICTLVLAELLLQIGYIKGTCCSNWYKINA
jgi:hypothetical protein